MSEVIIWLQQTCTLRHSAHSPHRVLSGLVSQNALYEFTNLCPVEALGTMPRYQLRPPASPYFRCPPEPRPRAKGQSCSMHPDTHYLQGLQPLRTEPTGSSNSASPPIINGTFTAQRISTSLWQPDPILYVQENRAGCTRMYLK